MRKNIFSVGLLFLFSAFLWSCSSSDSSTQDQSLQDAISLSTQELNDAITQISTSKGFQIITMNGDTKSEEEEDRFSASITLDEIAGVYDYNPNLNQEEGQAKFGMNRFFERTEDSELFVLRLPKEKADRPIKLYVREDGDEDLVNDFIISTSEYRYEFDSGYNFDYLLNADIEVEEVPAGELQVEWTISDFQKLRLRIGV